MSFFSGLALVLFALMVGWIHGFIAGKSAERKEWNSVGKIHLRKDK